MSLVHALQSEGCKSSHSRISRPLTHNGAVHLFFLEYASRCWLAGPYCEWPRARRGAAGEVEQGDRGGLPASAERGAQSLRAARELERLGAMVHWPGSGEAMDWGELAGVGLGFRVNLGHGEPARRTSWSAWAPWCTGRATAKP